MAIKNNNWLELFDLLVDEDLEALASMDVKAEIEALLQERKNENPNQLIYCFGCVVASAKYGDELVGQRLGDAKIGVENNDGELWPYTCTVEGECNNYDSGGPLYRAPLADIIENGEKNPDLGYALFGDYMEGRNRIRLSADEAQEYLDAAYEKPNCRDPNVGHDMACMVCGESGYSIQWNELKDMGYHDPSEHM